jgi:DNA mismatch repair protein MutS2
MDDRSLKALEFYQLLGILKTFSVSSLGRRRCEDLRPSRDPAQIRSRLAEVLELKEILETSGDVPLRGLKDIGEIFGRLEIEGSVLSATELLDVSGQIELCRGVKRFFQTLEGERFPRLHGKVSHLSAPRGLEREILQAIDPKGDILDRASPALSEIRSRLRTVRERAKAILDHLLRREDLKSVFQEDFITLRNGRYVVLVKAEHKNRLAGIVHDQSQSRMTFFFEPLQAVTHNNEINILAAEEKEEEYRILLELTRKVREEVQSLRQDLEILGEMDLLYAMARFSVEMKSTEPLLNQSGKIDLRNARHPLLSLHKGTETVPIHLRVGEGIRILIVSGSNAGGKTVALKTLGLLTLMVQSGLPIPVADGSEASVFEGVYAMIGDEQDLTEDLSTFSSHLRHLNQILEKAGPKTLILLDELGVGTHAQEGSALAMGYLDQFRETGGSVMVTTHFDRLKAYGYLHPEVQNVAVEFDQETLEPKFTLSYGLPGLSNAFLVAEKMGVPERVLDAARRYLEGGQEEVSRLLTILQGLSEKAESERIELLKMKEEAGLERRRLKELGEEIRKKRGEIFAQAEEKARKAAQRVEEELKEWVRRQKEEKSPRKVSLLGDYRKEAEETRERSFPSGKRKGPEGGVVGLKEGEYVKIESLRRSGVVTKVEEALKRVEILTEKGKVKTTFSDVVRISKEERETEGVDSKSRDIPREVPPETPSQTNVIGLTVEDALPIVDKFIDQALFHGLRKVEIIHGVGSGRLRSAIGRFLSGHRGVKGFAPGDGRGGAGVTVVELL